MKNEVQSRLEKSERQAKEAAASLKAFEEIDAILSRRFEEAEKKLEAGIMRVKELESSLEELPGKSVFETCRNDILALQRKVVKIEKKVNSQEFVKPNKTTSSLHCVYTDNVEYANLRADVSALQREMGNISRTIVLNGCEKDDSRRSIEENIKVSMDAALLRRRGVEGRSRSTSRDSRLSTYSVV